MLFTLPSGSKVELSKPKRRSVFIKLIEALSSDSNKEKIPNRNVFFWSTLKRENHKVNKDYVSFHTVRLFRKQYAVIKIYDTLEYIGKL